MKDKLGQFRKLGLEAKLTELYKEVLEIKATKQELPKEITGRLYTLRESADFVNMSKEWLTKEIKAGKITATFNKNKYYLSWQEIERIKDSRKKNNELL